jgi:hypothetical protein
LLADDVGDRTLNGCVERSLITGAIFASEQQR